MEDTVTNQLAHRREDRVALSAAMQRLSLQQALPGHDRHRPAVTRNWTWDTLG